MNLEKSLDDLQSRYNKKINIINDKAKAKTTKEC